MSVRKQKYLKKTKWEVVIWSQLPAQAKSLQADGLGWERRGVWSINSTCTQRGFEKRWPKMCWDMLKRIRSNEMSEWVHDERTNEWTRSRDCKSLRITCLTILEVCCAAACLSGFQSPGESELRSQLPWRIDGLGTRWRGSGHADAVLAGPGEARSLGQIQGICHDLGILDL